MASPVFSDNNRNPHSLSAAAAGPRDVCTMRNQRNFLVVRVLQSLGMGAEGVVPQPEDTLLAMALFETLIAGGEN
jgi:hypothetical protein